MNDAFELFLRNRISELGTRSHWIDVTPVESTDKPCRIGALDVRAQVCGLHAEVVQTIEVENSNGRDISAELALPLPDNGVVCGYALNIDGCLVDGVVVPKEKARVVFETEQRKGADPGLIEAVKGNAYRTRVYPVPANGKRTVQLRYVAPLVAGQDGVFLELPMPAEGLKRRTVHVEVETLDAPPIVLGLGSAQPQETRGCWTVECEEHDVKPGAHVIVGLPDLPETITVLERDEEGSVWVSVSQAVSLAGNGNEARITDLTVLWDASGSRAAADHERELKLLRSYCSMGTIESFTLVVFAECVFEVYELSSADELVECVRRIRYDGGTSLVEVSRKLATLPKACDGIANGSACLLFTDGLSTLDDEPLAFPEGSDVLAIVSGDERDAEAMRQACKGLAFALPLAPPDAAALVQAFNPDSSLRFLSVQGEGIADVCDATIPGSSRRSVIGRLTEPQAKLSFGNGLETYVLSADDAHVGNVLARAWAGKRVALLSTRASDNADELLSLGKRYGVASPVTSLLVLETLDQWLEHDIEPPAMLAEMRDEWRRRKAGEMRHTSEREEADRHRCDLAARWAQLLGWWERDYSVQRLSTVFCTRCGAPAEEGQRFCARCGSAILEPADADAAIESSVSDDASPMPSVPLERASRRNGGPLRAMAARVAEAFSPHEARASREAPAMNFADEDGALYAPMGMPAMAGGDFGGDFEDGLACDAVERAPFSDLPGSSSGLAASVSIRAWAPDTPYLSALDEALKTSVMAAHEAYFAQREEYRNSPSFFLDCAGWFMAHDDREFGLRVLTNLAELRIEDAALLRVMGWRFREAGELERALGVFRRILGLRGEDSQSYRDVALVLDELARAAYAKDDENGARAYAEEAGEFYRKVALTPWQRRPMAIGLFAVEEYNVMRAWAEGTKWKRAPELPALGDEFEGVLSCDLRVTLAWDADETDVDLHVTEPSGEEAYYAHNLTYAGGRVSEDITDGYGPELYAIRKAQEGCYLIRAHYYASHQQTVFGPATCTLTVYTDWGRPEQEQQITSTRLDKEHEMVDVGAAAYGSAADVEHGGTGAAHGGADSASDRSSDAESSIGRFAPLAVGMEASEVVALCGEPDARETAEAAETWVWELSGGRVLMAFFEHGAIIRVVERMSWGEEVLRA